MQQTPPRPINNKFAIVESHLLGKGSTGNVYLGFQRGQPHHQVAIKVINLTEIDNEVTRYLLNCEVAALSNLGKRQNTAHDNIVRLFDIVRHDHFIYLVTEILEGGTLANYIQRHPNGLTEEEALYIFRQIVEGYRHMRLRNVVHRDLKPDNVLFRTNPEHSKRVAIIDFGYCEMAEIPNKPQVYYNVGSPKYMSPQAFQDNRYSQKSDVWALGVMLYELLIGKTCDVGMGMEDYMEMVRSSGIPLPQHFSLFIKHLLSSILTYSPQVRYDCHQILKELNAYQTNHLTQSSILTNNNKQKDIQTEAKRQNKPQITLTPSPLRSKVVFQSMVRPFEPTQVVPNQPVAPSSTVLDKKLMKSNTIVNVSNSLQTQREVLSANQILGRVENVSIGSARQIVHRKHHDQGFHQTQNVQIPTQQHPPPQPSMPFVPQKYRLLIQPRNISANHTGPLTPVSVPARQLLTFSTINNIINDPNNSLRNTMPAQIHNLAIENASRAQRSQTNQQIDENNQMSPYPNKPNGLLSSQKPTGVGKKVQFFTQRRLFYNQGKEPMVMRSTIGPPPVSEFRLSSNYQHQQKNMSMPNIPQIRLFRQGFTH